MRQREERDGRILSAAMDLFRAEGFEAATMERIAEAAELSVGTLYNYYPTKGDVLGALVVREVAGVVRDGQRLVDDPPGDVATAIAELMKTYSMHALVDLTREMWRRAIALSIAQPDGAFARTYAAQDDAIRAQIVALVEALRARGLVRAEVDAVEVGAVLFDVMDRRFIRHVTDDGEPPETFARDLSRRADLVARALAPDAPSRRRAWFR